MTAAVVRAAPRGRLPIVCDQRPSKTAVVLLNVGTPDAPTTGAVRRFLREFLSDARVLDIPALGRWLLLHLVILPLRPRRSAAQYRKVWTDEGSPLLVHARALARGLQARLPDVTVITAMRYGNPSMRAMADDIVRAGADHVVLVPMFPQHASASTGTALQRAFAELGKMARVPNVSVVPEMFDDDSFIDAVCARFDDVTRGISYDHVLFSYHGLPVRQVQRVAAPGHTCAGTADASCCDALSSNNASCYRAQAMATTRLVAAQLGLGAAAHSTAFQSRLGRAQWLLPNTEDAIEQLVKGGVKDLVVLCPSFVADCLETVEEIGVRAREQFTRLGGRTLTLVPCINAHPLWVEGLARLVQRHLPNRVPSKGAHG